MRKDIPKVKTLVVNNKWKLISFIVLISVILIYFYIDDILIELNLFWVLIKQQWHIVNKEWFSIALVPLLIKSTSFLSYGLIKRQIINKSTETLKKVFLHNQIKWLLIMHFHIFLDYISNLRLVIKLMMIIPTGVITVFLVVKFYLTVFLKFLIATIWKTLLKIVLFSIKYLSIFILFLPSIILHYMSKSSFFIWLIDFLYRFWKILYSYVNWLYTPIWYIFGNIWKVILFAVLIFNNVLNTLIYKPFEFLELKITRKLKLSLLRKKGRKEYKKLISEVIHLALSEKRNRIKKKHDFKKKILEIKRKNKKRIEIFKKNNSKKTKNKK